MEEADFSILFKTRDDFVNYADSVELATEYFKFSENSEHEKANNCFLKCYGMLKETKAKKVCYYFLVLKLFSPV